MIFILSLELTEDKAVELALKNNPNILAESLEVSLSYEQSKEIGTSLWPQLSFKAGYTYNSYSAVFQQIVPTSWGFIETPPGSGRGIVFPMEVETVNIEFTRHHSFQMGLSLSKVLWSWGKLERAYSLMKEKAKAEYTDYLSKKAYYEYLVRQVYTLTLFSKERLDLANENLRFSEEKLRIIEEGYKNGRKTRLDYLRAKTDYEMAKVDLKNTENDYMNVKKNLLVLLGLPDTVEIVLNDSLKLIDTQFVNVDLKRYDILYLEEQAKVLEGLSREEIKGYLPTLYAQVSYNYQRPIGFEDKWGGNWIGSVILQWDIFNGLSPSVKSRNYKLQAEILRRRIEMLKLNAKKDMDDAIREYEHALDVLKANVEGLKTAEESFKLATEAYKNGRMSYSEFRDVEMAYRNYQLLYKKSLMDVKLAYLKVKFLSITSIH